MGWLKFWGRCLLVAFRPSFEIADMVLLVLPVVLWGGAWMTGYEIVLNLPVHLQILVALGLAFLVRLFLIAPYRLYQESCRIDGPLPNWPAEDAFLWLFSDSLRCVGRNADKYAFEYLGTEVRDAARLGLITVWGRPRYDDHHTLRQIPPEHWSDDDFIIGSGSLQMNDDPPIRKVWVHGTNFYSDMMFNRSEFRVFWKQAPWYRRLFDAERKARRALLEGEVIENGTG
jgi:hypothetical protein